MSTKDDEQERAGEALRRSFKTYAPKEKAAKPSQRRPHGMKPP